MKKRILGLMSGTSADGIDAALTEIDKQEGFSIKLLHHAHIPWSPIISDEIIFACKANAPVQRIVALNSLLGEHFANAAMQVALDSSIPLTEIDAIASHGQTIWHQPEPFEVGGSQARGTLQIGEPAIIAARTGCTVISDFRSADMAWGGQGAPLVPFADFALFASPNETRCIQNLGGISNVTYLPAGGSLEDIIAFDIGPCNMLLDFVVRTAWRGKAFDEGGKLALQGKADTEYTASLQNLSYFSQKPPKSTGREQFGVEWCSVIYDSIRHRGNKGRDILATCCEFIAMTIANAYRDFLPRDDQLKTVILGGGGVKNHRLMNALKDYLPGLQIKTHSDFGVPNEAKEAMAFALLGYETLHGRPSNVPSATGAHRSAVLGKITR